MRHLQRTLLTILAVLTVSVCLAGCDPSGRRCDNECAQGEQRCASSADAYEVCDDYDGDACLEWGGQTACQGGTTCSGGFCVSDSTGLVLTGELVPAGGGMAAGDLHLSGSFSKDFGREASESGALTLTHSGFTSRHPGD